MRLGKWMGRGQSVMWGHHGGSAGRQVPGVAPRPGCGSGCREGRRESCRRNIWRSNRTSTQGAQPWGWHRVEKGWRRPGGGRAIVAENTKASITSWITDLKFEIKPSCNNLFTHAFTLPAHYNQDKLFQSQMHCNLRKHKQYVATSLYC